MFIFMIVLGVVQGLTEFLPISSSGHLVLTYKLFNFSGNNLLLSILLHVATLLSVCIYYRHDLIQLIKHPFCKTNINILIASIPTVLIVLIFESFVTSAFGGSTLFWGFIITAILLVTSDNVSHNNELLSKSSDVCIMPIKWWQALVIGISQGIACVPGLSRSGTTISCACFVGVDKQYATKFSFLISIPVIVGSLLFELLRGGISTINVNGIQIIIAFVVAFICGLIAIRYMERLVSSGKLYYFSYYLIVLATLLLVL